MSGHVGGCPCCQPTVLCRVTLTSPETSEEIATDIIFTAPRSQTRDAAGFRQALACVAWGAAFTAGGGAWDVGGDEADPLQGGKGEWELGAIEVATEYRGEPFYLNARIDGPTTDDMPFAPVQTYLASGLPSLAVYPNRRRAEEAARVEREAPQ